MVKNKVGNTRFTSVLRLPILMKTGALHRAEHFQCICVPPFAVKLSGETEKRCTRHQPNLTFVYCRVTMLTAKRQATFNFGLDILERRQPFGFWWDHQMHCSLRKNFGNKMAAPMVLHPKCLFSSISKPLLSTRRVIEFWRQPGGVDAKRGTRYCIQTWLTLPPNLRYRTQGQNLTYRFT